MRAFVDLQMSKKINDFFVQGSCVCVCVPVFFSDILSRQLFGAKNIRWRARPKKGDYKPSALLSSSFTLPFKEKNMFLVQRKHQAFFTCQFPSTTTIFQKPSQGIMDLWHLKLQFYPSWDPSLNDLVLFAGRSGRFSYTSPWDLGSNKVLTKNDGPCQAIAWRKHQTWKRGSARELKRFARQTERGD